MRYFALTTMLLMACSTTADREEAGAPDASDASDATVPFDTGACGQGSDSGCGCGQPPPVYAAQETLGGDLALFDGGVPDGACPSLTFGVPWSGSNIEGATLFRGCTNTTLFLTSTCGGTNDVSDYLVFDKQGKIIGATQMGGQAGCISTGTPPDYVPCGADASYPFECEVLCGCDTWHCRPFEDAGAADATAD